MRAVALHGFFGKVGDFDFLQQNFQYYPIGNVTSKADFQRAFVLWLKDNVSLPCELFAYSMGARVALELLLSQPHLFSKATLVSCHLGLKSEEEKARRLEQDLLLSEKFLTLPWEKLNALWEAQEVFSKGLKRLDRKECDYPREALASQLLYLSLAHQPDLRESLSKNTVPITWITGGFDTPYDEMGKEACQLNKLISHVSIPFAGHRVPWDQREMLQKAFSLK